MKEKKLITYNVLTTKEFEQWLNTQATKSRFQIADRLLHIQQEGHFGLYKNIGNHIWELKWRNGRRVYYAFIPEAQILVLLGGNKNGQSKDIRQAKTILSKWVEKKATE